MGEFSEKKGANTKLLCSFNFFHMLLPRLEVQTSRCDALTMGGFIVNLPVFLFVIICDHAFK